MNHGTPERRPPGLPLHWRVRLCLWGVAAFAVITVAAAGQGLLAALLGLGMVLLLAAVGEPTVRAVRRHPARAGVPEDEAATLPGVPPPAEPTAASDADADADAAADAAADAPAEAVDGTGAELAQALADGGVTVRYRPLRTLPELMLCGVEAELRWDRPSHGLLAPDDWPARLPPAVADALLARWIEPACAQFVRWLPRLDTQANATLWLRLPALWLEAPGLQATLERALAGSGLERSRLRLRVAPRALGRHAVLPAPAQQLQRHGYALAVDAFGGGAASLAHLNDLPVRAVCLDRSLIERACHGTSQRLVVESTARLAGSLGMRTLADGVATESQVLTLGELGCELGLGEVCGPWLDAEDWSVRWAVPRVADPA